MPLDMPPDWVIVLAGSLIGGFTSGLTGFGFALVTLPFYLQTLPPGASAQLSSACSVASQMRTMAAIWPAIDATRAAPMILAGLAGVPIGVLIVPHVGVGAFRATIGAVLVAYSVAMLILPAQPRRHASSWRTQLVVGLGAGILGGLASLSGVLPTVYATLMGWEKEEKRGFFQAFNASILAAMLVWSLAAGHFTWQTGRVALIALPAALAGVTLGHAVFRRLDNRRFDRIVLLLLLASGVTLIAGAR